MRLLSVDSYELGEFEGSNIPSYAILSHRWEAGEVTYQDMMKGLRNAKKKPGFDKIRQCCAQAKKAGLDWAWVDTCCIDKSSSAELTEAINSMYQWYQDSDVCYAYLSDVRMAKYTDPEYIKGLSRDDVLAEIEEEIKSSKWWTRGWTLQELIAPREVIFFADGRSGWGSLGPKSALIDLISYRTGISQEVLGGLRVEECSIAMRMSWASDRETTRVEDMAYCLLGIFKVNMPLLYGEGKRAFIRLQEEIMKQSDDQTLFAWQLYTVDPQIEMCGPLATSPSLFRDCSDLVPVSDLGLPTPYSMTNKGLRIELSIIKGNRQAILQCSTRKTFPRRLVLPIVQVSQDEQSHFARSSIYTFPLRAVESNEIATAVSRIIYMRQEPMEAYAMRTELLVDLKRTLYTAGGILFFDSTTTLLANQFRCPIWNAFYSRTDSRKGAVIFENSEFDVVVLYNFGSPRVERLSCKVLLAVHDEHKNHFITTPGVSCRNLVNSLAPSAGSDKRGKPGKPVGRPFERVPIANHTDMYEDPAAMRNARANLTELEKLYTDESGCPTSFAELTDGWVVRADMTARLIQGQSTRVLKIELTKLTDRDCPWHELPTSNDQSCESPDDETCE